jgi:hypothetical protein
LYYWYGRLFNILLVFEPIDNDNFSNSDLPDFNRLATTTLSQGFDSPPTPYNDEISEGAEEEEQIDVDLPGNYFTNAFFFTRGFTDSAFRDTSPNSTICEGNLTQLAQTTKAVKQDFFETIDPEIMHENAIEF